MFVKEKQSGDLIRVSDLQQLSSPLSGSVDGRRQAGEEEQDQKSYAKRELVFPSGETLPRCWIDPDYQTES